MRKIISLLLGLAMMIAGAWGFAYMFFHSEPVKLIVWAIPISVFAFGCALLWEDVTDLLKSGRNNS